MEKLKTVIQRRELPSSVYLFREDWKVEDINLVVEAAGFAFFYLDGTEILTESDFMNSGATSMNFPEGFGENWDAFYDFMRDLSWYPAQGYLLLYDNFQFFSQDSPEAFFIAYRNMQTAAEFWEKRSQKFYVLLRGQESALPSLLPDLPTL